MDRTIYSFPLHLRVLIATTLVFVALILILLFIIMSSRIVKTQRANRKAYLLRKYENILSQLLFEDESLLERPLIFTLIDKKDLKKPFDRKVVLESIVHLHESFTGEPLERLEKIYQSTELHLDSINRLKHRRWDIVAGAMRELAYMNIKSAIPKLKSFLNSKHEILRYEARVALMKLSDSDHLSFLDSEKAYLSEWDQANIYTILAKMPKETVPDFGRWLNSSNPSVVEFAISMTGAFQQNKNLPNLLAMLDEATEKQRIQIIRTFNRCNNSMIVETLIARYEQETESIKDEILQSFTNIGTKQATVFLASLLKRPQQDIAQTVFILRSLLRSGEAGQILVEETFRQGNERMKMAVLHAKDQRL